MACWLVRKLFITSSDVMLVARLSTGMTSKVNAQGTISVIIGRPPENVRPVASIMSDRARTD
ncbi:hypothetical protein GCM10007158_14170 [Vreelandella hamiltonii]|uniref:Uncharacterized protein n=1 Tax=Halomonas johnsoniae TaxID=502832 RepID=A0ABQ2WIQ2_9GAMM|nr:hypothetical protein GCM10007158_14170 [Halomonas johnsoniae]